MKNNIAIIGASFDLPGIRNWEDLASSINEYKCHIGDISQYRKNDLYNNLGKFEAMPGGYLDRIDLFDKEIFGITEVEALRMSPEQRLMLMHSIRAFNDAGYNKKHLNASKTGIFYVAKRSRYNLFFKDKKINYDQIQGMEGTRIANFFNLHGPVISLDTSCSSSLVAMHYACLSLKNMECDMVLTGGVRLGMSDKEAAKNVAINSKNAVCKPFDENADGTLTGEGVVCMVLKRYEDAVNDNDPIYAVIEGSALNHGGSRISSLTAPSSEAQKEVIVRAWNNSGVNPEEIKYIEAHGTGTFLGDPIEFKGLNDALKDCGVGSNSCSISSFKSQVGHLDTLSGSAGVLRIIAALNNKIIPSQVGFNSLNKHIDEKNSSILVNRSIKHWEEINGKRIGGVSSFGLTGTNAHFVISNETTSEMSDETKDQFFIQISEKTQQRLENFKDYLIDYLKSDNEIDLSSFVRKINRSYVGENFKEGIVFSSKSELLEKLNNKIVFKKEQAKFFLLLLSQFHYDNSQIKSILNENELIREQWNLISKGNINLDSNANKELVSILFQYTLCKFVLSILGKDVTIIYPKEVNTIQKLVSGELTTEEVLKNPEQIHTNINSFNTQGFIDYLNQFWQKGDGISIFAFCGNDDIKTELASKGEINWISGQFSVNDRYNFYSGLLNIGKNPLEVPTNAKRINNLALPYFELKRYWPENVEPLKKESCKKDSAEIKAPKSTWPIQEIQEEIKSYWKELLEIEDGMNISDDFFDLGGTSLTGLDVLNKIEQEFGVILQYQDIFKYSKLEEITSLVNSNLNKNESVKVSDSISTVLLDVDSRDKEYSNLLNSIRGMKTPSLIAPKKILVTGGTGYLGAFLIEKLLNETDAQIVCLVRGTSVNDANDRFWKRYASYFNIYNHDRIHVLLSDITNPDLGLENEELDVLEEIDMVYHSAGLVSHFGKYETSYKANVEGSKNIFNWAIRNKVKWFNHISTRAVTGVCISGSNNDNFYETDLNIGQDFINHIYGKTKLKAEEYLRNSDSNMSVNIYRLGNIGGRSSDGLFQYNIDKHNVYLQLATLAKVGCYSDYINNIGIEITPIDIILEAILKLSRTHNDILSTFHLIDNQEFNLLDIVGSFRNNGINIIKVENEDFVKKIEELNSEKNSSKDTLTIGVQKYSNIRESTQGKGVLEITDQCTREYLNKLEVSIKYDRKKYLDTIIKYGLEKEFFNYIKN